jgi:hypothetical protein
MISDLKTAFMMMLFYSVAHSDSVIVETSNGKDFLLLKTG